MRRFASLCLLLIGAVAGAHPTFRFSVTWNAAQLSTPFSGRVVVFFGVDPSSEPRYAPDWFNPKPIFSRRVVGIRPGAKVELTDANSVTFPKDPGKVRPGRYFVQAVVDRNLGGRMLGASPGNLISVVEQVEVGANGEVDAKFVCDKVIPDPTFAETRHTKLFEMRSALLSKFMGRPTTMGAAVILPDAWYAQPDRKFPVLYETPGFGGNRWWLSGADSAEPCGRGGVDFVYVMLDPDCPTGHCVFADSANNGPWGHALTTEFIPALEKKFRGIGQPGARFVTGHSSGGWSSLWLQVAYPDFFGGVWSTSPDPVDFHAFQLVDIYAPGANMFADKAGKPNPVARFGETPALYARQFSDMERPIRGEQFGSFEAVFSPRGLDGEPEPLWNRDTGVIDPEVAEQWKRYDIALMLRTHWAELGPKLKGKLHVFCGLSDTFYLDSAVKLLKKEMSNLGSDAEVEMLPGDHGSVLTAALRKHMDAEMAAQFKGWRAQARS